MQKRGLVIILVVLLIVPISYAFLENVIDFFNYKLIQDKVKIELNKNILNPNELLTIEIAPTYKGFYNVVYILDDKREIADSIKLNCDNTCYNKEIINYYIPSNFNGDYTVNVFDYSTLSYETSSFTVTSEPSFNAAAFEAQAIEYHVKQDGTGDFTTIQACANTAQAGDTCLVHSGTYYETVSMQNSGNDVNGYITFKAYPGDKPVIDGTTYGFNVGNRNYIKIEGFEIFSCTADGIYATSGDNVQVLNNIVHDCQNGIFFGTSSGGTTNALIQGNIVYNVLADCIGSSWSRGGDIIKNNEVYGCGTDGIQASGTGVVIDNNLVHDIGDSSCAAHGDGIVLEPPGSGTTSDITIKNNVVYDVCSAQIYIDCYLGGSIINTKVYNNIIYRDDYTSWLSGIAFHDECSGTLSGDIYNNIVVDQRGAGSGRSIYYATDGPPNPTGVVKNNIFVNGPVHIYAGADVSLDYNNYYCDYSPGCEIINWKGSQYSDLNTFRSATGQEANGIQANPLFANWALEDYHHTSNSPGIDKGTDLSSLIDSVDKDGITRPQGSAWDMGAYEYQQACPLCDLTNAYWSTT